MVCDMVKTDLDDECWHERLPLSRSLSRPPARCSGRIPSEAWFLNKCFQLFRQGGLIGLRNTGSKADMVKMPPLVIEA